MTRLDDIREIVKALREAPNYNTGLGTSTLEDEAADLIDELSAENEQMSEDMLNAEIHADCMEARAIAFEAEVKRWVDKHNQAAVNFQQENAECRRLSAEVERLREGQRWIPVRKRLPERYQYVLIYASLWEHPVWACLRDDDEFWTGIQAVSPTHWMPLPSAPEGEKENV